LEVAYGFSNSGERNTKAPPFNAVLTVRAGARQWGSSKNEVIKRCPKQPHTYVYGVDAIEHHPQE